jgi:hypothetical protein
MPDKMKIPNQRKHKESQGRAKGAKKTHLTELEKILISNGGMAHSLLRGRGTRFAPTIKKRRRD